MLRESSLAEPFGLVAGDRHHYALLEDDDCDRAGSFGERSVLLAGPKHEAVEIMKRVVGRRLCYVVSSEMTVEAFLKSHIQTAALCYQVTVAVNTSDPNAVRKLGLQAKLLQVAIERRAAPWRDLKALWALYKHFRRERFDLVHSISPKAGLLGMLSACLAGVPRRVHTFTGQVWVTRRGWRRTLLKTADRLLARLCTHVLVDSPSQQDFLVAEGIMPAAKATIIGSGSICGVDSRRFKPDASARHAVRTELVIPDPATVLIFVGRLGRDKGILDLASAFASLSSRFPDLYLLLVGPDEEALLEPIRVRCGEGGGRLRHVLHTPKPERFMAAADILCLPSYREGFGMVTIEAASAGLATVASRIYGITDAVVDGKTGLLFPPGDIEAMSAALDRLIVDRGERQTMGVKGRERVLSEFSAGELTRGLMMYYEKILRPERL